MTAINIEPGCMQYEAHLQLSKRPDTLSEFRAFCEQLRCVLQQLEDNGIYIACTREFKKLCWDQIPAVRCKYPAQLSLEKERFRLLLLNRFQRVSIQVSKVDFRKGTIHDPSGVLKSDALYVEWKSVVGAILCGEAVEIVICRNDATVFINNGTTLVDTGSGATIDVTLVEDLDSQECQGILALWRLAGQRAGPPDMLCHGTGGHASMWGPRIKSLADVPEKQRKLLDMLKESGLVSEITFLDFGKQSKSVQEPEIVLSSTKKPSSGVVSGRFRGSGKNQNAQSVSLKLNGAAQDDFLKAFPRKIDKKRLDRLLVIRRLNRP